MNISRVSGVESPGTHYILKPLAVMFASLIAYSSSANDSDTETHSVSDLIKPHIVGGSETPQGSRSYQAMLLMNGNQGCGGTLIADNWVLTAAHCLDSANTSSLTVKLGAHYRTSGGTTHNVTQIIRHPNWQGAQNIQSGYDIALLKLSSPAASNLTRAALPTAAIQNEIAGVGKYVTVSGWGNTSNGGYPSNVLLEVDLPVLSTQACQQQLSYSIDGKVICGDGPNGTSACNGDSGGPYVAKKNGVFYSIGTVSWGKSCRGATAFTRTLSYVDWINSHIGNGGGGGGGGGSSELQNGQSVSVSGAQGSENFYTLQVPAGASNLSFNLSGGSGDADLYVKFGSKPSANDYDCRPYKNGNTENCDFASPSSGTYHVMLKGYAAYSGASLIANYQTSGGGGGGGAPTPIDADVTNISVSAGAWKRYTLDLGTGYNSLTVSISGGYGDADLYVRRGAQSSESQYDCRPYKNGNSESCNFSSPAGGVWHIDIKGYSSANGVNLNVKAN